MLNMILFAMVFLGEALILFFYLESTFRPKQKLSLRIFAYLTLGSLQFGLSNFEFPVANLAAFLLSVLLLSNVLYETRFRTCIFQTILVSSLMATSEYVAFSLLSLVTDAEINIRESSFMDQIIAATFSKLLFFVALYLLSRFAFRDKKRRDTLQSLALVIFPVSSVLVLCAFHTIAVQHNASSQYVGLFIASTIFLLFSNIIVFMIYEAMQKMNLQNTQLQLALQKEKISSEYYELLHEEQEATRVLAHDIKSHMRILTSMVEDDRANEIPDYLVKLVGDYRIYERIPYSGNRFVDVIINRYVQFCREQAIELEVDLRRASLDFMSADEITALLDNMLSNATEAAISSTEKKIELILCEQNMNYVVIRLRNSCDVAPKEKNGILLSNKGSNRAHGFGIKSIKRVLKKYDGQLKWCYDAEAAEFEMQAVLKKKPKET